MTIELYKQVVITRDLLEKQLYRGDVAVLVDFIEQSSGREQGVIVEILNVLGESIDMVTVPLSAVGKNR